MKMTRAFFLMAMITALLGILVTANPTSASPAGSAFAVTRLDDPTPDGCAVGDCSLREAIIAANADPDYSLVTIPLSGRIELAITGADEENAATGDLDINSNMTITGTNQIDTIIDANGLDRVFDVPSAPDHLLMGDGVIIQDVTITGGNVLSADEGVGGGVNVRDGRTVTLTDVIVDGNQGTGGSFGLGGGVSNNGGNVSILGSVIMNNTSDNAAGVSNLDGFMAISNSTITNNSAPGSIGGIINLSNTEGVTATLGLDSVTIAENEELSGGNAGAGLDTTSFAGAARTTVQNSIITNNVGEFQCYFGGTGTGGGVITSLGYNIADDASCSLTGTADLPDTDALLGALVMDDNTYFHFLSVGSPAYDSGSTAGTLDQRDNPRPVDIGSIPNTTDGDDRGAVEMPGIPTAVTVSTWQVTSANGGAIAALVVGLASLAVAGFVAWRRR
jgi:CSLREA domain-containing protein